jgi:hypothetical protein
MKYTASSIIFLISCIFCFCQDVKANSSELLNQNKRAFLENKAKNSSEIPYYLTGENKTVWLTKKSLVFDLRKPALKNPAISKIESGEKLSYSLEMLGANGEIIPSEELPGSTNIFHGQDSSQINLKSYKLITYKNLWPDTDLRIYSRGEDLEQEYVLNPGANPDKVKLHLNGVDKVSLTDDGSLIIATPFGELKQEAPFAYQTVGGKRQAVPVKLVLKENNTYSFSLGKYNHDKPLVIDPVLLFSTYLGGIHNDVPIGVTFLSDGNILLTGYTASEDFPITADAIENTRKNLGTYTYDIFVTKVTPSGEPIYSTFIGGRGNEFPTGLFIGSDNTIYLGVQTNSDDFPVTPGTLRTTFGGNYDGAVLKLNSEANLILLSTYISGSTVGTGNVGNDFVTGLGVDSQGRILVAGGTGSTDFPVTGNAVEGSYRGGALDGFFMILNSTLSDKIYSTYLGGSGADYISRLYVDNSGFINLVGGTNSANYPVTGNAQDPTPNGGNDVSITKLSADGVTIVYASYFGGNGNDNVADLGHDSSGNLIISGDSTSNDFPFTSSAYGKTFTGTTTAFLLKIAADGTAPIFATGIGPSAAVTGTIGDFFNSPRLAVSPDGSIIVAGTTESSSFPLTSDAIQTTKRSTRDAFISRISSDGSQLLYSTLVGGAEDDAVNAVTTDSKNNIYAFGGTKSLDFPVTPSAYQSTYSEGGDLFDLFLLGIGNGILSSVTPQSAGNKGSVTLTLRGNNLGSFTSAALVSGSKTITAVTGSLNSDSSVLTLVFNLKDELAGTYDIVITKSDASQTTLSQAFTIDASKHASQVFARIISRPAIRLNSRSLAYINVGNTGGADAFGTEIQLEYPAALEVAPYFPITEVPTLSGAAKIDVDHTPFQISAGNNRIASLTIPIIPAGSSYSLPVFISSGTLGDYSIKLKVLGPLFSSFTDASAFYRAQAKARGASLDDVFKLPGAKIALLTPTLRKLNAGEASANSLAYINALLLSKALTFGALNSGRQGLSSTITANSPQLTVSNTNNIIFDAALMTEKLASDAGLTSLRSFRNGRSVVARDNSESGGYFDPPVPPDVPYDPGKPGFFDPPLPPTQPVPEDPRTPDDGGGRGEPIIPDPFDSPDEVYEGGGSHQDVRTPNDEPVPQFEDFPPVIQTIIRIQNAIDPNDKSGPSGTDTGHWIKEGELLTYSISFENLASAALPAQTVSISDHLDSAKVNLSSLKFGAVSIGTKVIPSDSNAKKFSGELDLRPGKNLVVKISGLLDETTNTITWNFKSIDPTTNLPPADTTEGFLPPNKTPPEGEGSVNFTIEAMPGLASGTTITNQATIVFDSNTSIDTPIWSNSIAAPVSGKLRVSPKNLVFKDGAKNKPLSLTVTNDAKKGGDAILTGLVLISGGGEIQNPEDCENILLEAGEKCKLKVAYSGLGGKRGVISILNTGAETATVKYSGKGKAAALALKPGAITFKKTAVGSQSAARSVIIKNSNKTSVAISGFNLNGSGFGVTDNSCGGKLEPKKSCTVKLAFTPSKAGKAKGTFAVNVDGGKTLKVKLAGKG